MNKSSEVLDLRPQAVGAASLGRMTLRARDVAGALPNLGS